MVNFPKPLNSMCLLQLVRMALMIIGQLTRTWTQQWFTLNELYMPELPNHNTEERAKGIKRYKYWSTYLKYVQSYPPISQLSPNFDNCINEGKVSTFLENSIVVPLQIRDESGRCCCWNRAFWAGRGHMATPQPLRQDGQSYNNEPQSHSSGQNILNHRHLWLWLIGH